MKLTDALIPASAIIGVLALAWISVIAQRPLSKYQEETRRLVYQESTTAATACRANLSRLYVDWTKSEGRHRTALEAMARDESRRSRCGDLDPAVVAWLESIQ